MSAQIECKEINILLVEDNPADARLTQEVFKDTKVRNKIHLVEDGVEAMDFLRREGRFGGSPRPDLILLDLNLPRKNGREVLEDIKADENLKRIPVVRSIFQMCDGQNETLNCGCRNSGSSMMTNQIVLPSYDTNGSAQLPLPAGECRTNWLPSGRSTTSSAPRPMWRELFQASGKCSRFGVACFGTRTARMS